MYVYTLHNKRVLDLQQKRQTMNQKKRPTMNQKKINIDESSKPIGNSTSPTCFDRDFIYSNIERRSLYIGI